MSGVGLVRKLLDRGMTEAAQEVARLLEEHEELVPHAQAVEWELKWLLAHIKREATSARVAFTIVRGPEEEDREAVGWTKAAGPIAKKDGYGLAVIEVPPRLASLLAGEIPAERAFREGRMP